MESFSSTSLDDQITERLRLFELADIDEAELQLLCHRKENRILLNITVQVH